MRRLPPIFSRCRLPRLSGQGRSGPGPSRRGLSRRGLSRRGLSRRGLSRRGLSRRGLAMAALAPALAAVALLGLLRPKTAAADERQIVEVDGKGAVPTYRTTGPALLVCPATKADFDERVAGFPDDLKAANVALWAQCQAGGYRTLQEAVNKVDQPGTTIKILPGVYLEQPSLAAPAPECATVATLSWEQQVQCPHNQNLVAVLAKKDLQIEGTGAKPDDVILDAQFKKLNGVRADRSSGVYLRNFTVQRAAANAVYVMEADGFAIDKVIGRWNGEHGFQTLADDHGHYTDCEAYGNGNAGLSTTSIANINAKDSASGPLGGPSDRIQGDAAHRHSVDRYAVEIKGCRSHHNLLGYSGTAGNSVWAHDNQFTDNTVGVAMDSATPNQPGLPQNHALFESNVIAANNQDYYRFVRDGTCQKPYPLRGYEDGVVCPMIGVPVGTGVFNPGGNYNVWRANRVYANTYAGFVTSWVPGFVREDNRFAAQFDTSHHNRYDANTMGVAPDGTRAPNGMDYWWDGQGVGSCWQRPSWDGAEPRVLPQCGAADLPAGFGTARYLGEPAKVLKLFVCSNYEQANQRIPADCDWFGARGFQRVEVKYALGGAILIGLVLLVLWLRLLSRSGAAFLGLVLALGGLVVGVYGTLNETTALTAIGLGLLGLGWLFVAVALRRRGRAGLSWLTMGLALFTTLGAVDRGLLVLPWIPVPPSLVRIVLESLWVPAALVAASRGRMPAVTRTRPSRRADGSDPRGRNSRRDGRDRKDGPTDPLERFAATLRQ